MSMLDYVKRQKSLFILSKKTLNSEAFLQKIFVAANAAAADMVQKAVEMTPPRNGEIRGKNTWTSPLRDGWKNNVKRDNKGVTVTLYNNQDYASYVDQGHRLTRHFVPWLYVDRDGVLTRHAPIPGEPLFGLVVGTKTKYIKPYNMVKAAKKEFYKRFDIALQNTITDLKKGMKQ